MKPPAGGNDELGCHAHPRHVVTRITHPTPCGTCRRALPRWSWIPTTADPAAICGRCHNALHQWEGTP